jgi:hypothetical protein
MNRGDVVLDTADHGGAVRWFVGVVTATTQRGEHLILAWLGPGGHLVCRSKDAGLVG